MPITQAKYIWHNGKLVPWEKGDSARAVARPALRLVRLRG
jgi:hypothetical protein